MVYVAIGPFFVVEPAVGTGKGSGGAAKGSANVVSSTLGGASAMKALRISALALVRKVNVFDPSAPIVFAQF